MAAADAAQQGPRGHRRRGGSATRVRPRAWCCSFGGAPDSPDLRPLPSSAASPAAAGPGRKLPPKSPSSAAASFYGSPTSSRLAGLGGLIDPRRILSPGRVSPIDPDAGAVPPPPLPLPLPPPPPPPVVGDSAAVGPAEQPAVLLLASALPSATVVAVREEADAGGVLDLRLFLRGRDGRCVLMELDSGVLCGCSDFFAAMAPREDAAGAGAGGKRIEVDGVENLDAFMAAVELMYDPHPMRCLAAAGVSRAIDVLEVCSSIMFSKGIKSCLTYIEAVPWNENEEEKLKNLFARFTFDEAISQDILARLRPHNWKNSDDLTVQLIQSVTSSTSTVARKDMQSLVNGLLSKSSVYQKDSSQGPNLEQWNLADRVCKFLKNFADATKVFSQHNSPSSHRYVEEVWGIRELLFDEKSISDKFLKVLCDDMKSKFDKYWDEPNKILLVASLLDPRYKLVFLKYCLMKVYGEEVADSKANAALIWFKAYYSRYESMPQRSYQSNVSSSPEVGGSASPLSFLSGKRKLGLEFALFRHQRRPQCSRRPEVDTYLYDPLVPSREGEEFDVLGWWKRNQDQYPVLAKMSRDFLAIPLSTVASESTFNTASIMIDKYRNSLSSETVEALICAKDWLKEYLSDDEDDDGEVTTA